MVKGTVDIEELKQFQKNLEKIKNSDEFLRSCTQELAARLMRKAIKNTPVGDYSHMVTRTAKRDSKNHKKGDKYQVRVNTSGKVGGTLRRGWTNGPVYREGNSYCVDIINPVEYASYVEYGHRTANHRSWVKGQFFMTKSEEELQSAAAKILQAKVNKYLKEAFK